MGGVADDPGREYAPDLQPGTELAGDHEGQVVLAVEDLGFPRVRIETTGGELVAHVHQPLHVVPGDPDG